MHTLVLLRHGQSEWNRENRFTGWTDVDLSDEGKMQAADAGRELAKTGIFPDVVYTSVLKRAIHTAWIMLDAMDRAWVPVEKSWRLNERQYGGLQGLNKSEMAEKYGEEQVHLWRRGFDIAPPPLPDDQFDQQKRNPVFSSVPSDLLPHSESLKDTIIRVMPYWNETILPALREGKTVVVAAHGNSLRAMMKELEHISDTDIVEVNLPTGFPLVYELDDDMAITGKRYLGDPEKVEAAISAVKNQGKSSK